LDEILTFFSTTKAVSKLMLRPFSYHVSVGELK
jgi:hypothetical protein